MPAAVPLLGRQLVLLRQRLLTEKRIGRRSAVGAPLFAGKKIRENIDYGKIFIDKR